MSHPCEYCDAAVIDPWATIQLEIIRNYDIACQECWEVVHVDTQVEFLKKHPEVQEDLEEIYDVWVDSVEREEKWREFTFYQKLKIRDKVDDDMLE